MKKIIVCLAVAAVAALSLQAGESSKDKASCCDSKAKTTASCSSSKAAACKSTTAAMKPPQTAKGGQLAQR